MSAEGEAIQIGPIWNETIQVVQSSMAAMTRGTARRRHVVAPAQYEPQATPGRYVADY
jgi:hypothetical protein